MWTEILTGILAVATVVLAVATVRLAASTKNLAQSTADMATEAHEASARQLGVQTWLHLAARFDSDDIRRARARFAEQMEKYDISMHDEITEEVLNVFEDIGTLYRLGLINKELADSAFSYYASRWWEAARTYIYQERDRNKDEKGEIFEDFEAFAKEMRRSREKLDTLDMKKFLNDEKQLNKL